MRRRSRQRDEPRLLPDWDVELHGGPTQRVLVRLLAWYEWTAFLVVFPLAMVMYWIFRLSPSLSTHASHRRVANIGKARSSP